MKIRDAQTLGLLAALVASLAVYGADLSGVLRSRPARALPWGDQLPGTVAVQVSGDRDAGGVYFFPEGTRLGDALRHAGMSAGPGPAQAGSGPGIFEDGIALHLLTDGRIRIGDMPAATRFALGLPIDVNLASAEELEMVPGIGEKLAARIVQTRQEEGAFRSLQELTAIPGIKAKKLEQIEKYLTVGTDRCPDGRRGSGKGKP